jgi:hypothetical protein
MTPIVGTPITRPVAPSTGGGPLNRKQLRDAVAREFGLWEGGATSGSYSTLADSVRLARFANDFFIGTELYIESTSDNLAPQGEVSFITDFVASTGLCTVSPLFTAPTDNCDWYQIFKWVTKADIDRALAEACSGVDIATTLTIKTNTVDYYISAMPGFSRPSQITGVWHRPHNDLQYQPVPIYGYQIEDAEGQLVLRLPERLTDTTDALWFTYKGDGQYFMADTQYVNLSKPLVVARACVLLIEAMLAQNDAGGAERWGTVLRYWVEKLTRLERQAQPPASKSKSYPWAARRSSSSRADEALGLTPNF